MTDRIRSSRRLIIIGAALLAAAAVALLLAAVFRVHAMVLSQIDSRALCTKFSFSITLLIRRTDNKTR